ncbi:N-acetylmuramoyl-L-alanine amidase [Galbibacter marinus]|uniref:N-acetylmuramoyl-L-alanine amidase n=1 Tax=Galbibacter marinus TaxID=555500 RepID=K2PRE0_9FLAO|nr:N-acetylmuramoyl-L-alanine amidase [Galbibacter marinus]
MHRTDNDEVHTKASIAIGFSILEESTGNLGFKEPGVKFANFQALWETTGYCPSVLVEWVL